MLPTVLPHYQLCDNLPFSWREGFLFYRFLAGNPDSNKGEGFYHRLVYAPNRREYCLQVVLYYRKQLIPYHVNDYHPFYAYYDEAHDLKRFLYDTSHHYISRAPVETTLEITVRFPWHGYRYGRSLMATTFEAADFKLTNRTLVDWWLQPGKPQFKLRSKFADPWHPGLFASADDSRPSFRDEAVCPYCGLTEYLDTMELSGTEFHVKLKCRKGHLFIARYDAQKMAMSSST